MTTRFPVDSSHKGDQLELFTRKEMGVVQVPWEGISPRDLTRGSKVVIFQSREKKCMSELISPVQFELWQSIERPGVLPGPSSFVGGRI